MDLHNTLKITPAIAPQVGTDNTPFVSAIIDTANYPGLEFAICTGTLSDAGCELTILVEHDTDAAGGTMAAVGDDELLGTEAGQALTQADDGETRKIGYIGAKRYVRLTITPANNAGNIPIAAVAIQGGARVQPVA